ncbi:hypothetical protein Avbf_11674 [Armadillidium vulgare]|nr:hypothetical protein Avbf_11674 [Armadillidium vulgare]
MKNNLKEIPKCSEENIALLHEKIWRNDVNFEMYVPRYSCLLCAKPECDYGNRKSILQPLYDPDQVNISILECPLNENNCRFIHAISEYFSFHRNCFFSHWDLMKKICILAFQ